MNATKVRLLVLANFANIPDTCLVQLNQIIIVKEYSHPNACNKAKITCQTFSAYYSQVMKQSFHTKPVGITPTSVMFPARSGTLSEKSGGVDDNL